MQKIACLLFCLCAITAQGSSTDRVNIRSQKTILIRSGKIVRDFPQKRRVVVIQPVFSGLTPPVLSKLRTTLNLKNIFGSSLREYQQESWLEEFSYEVHFNRHGLLDISFTQSGSGAYPDSQTKHFIVDLKTGRIVNAVDIIRPDQMEQLAKLIDLKLQAEIKQVLAQTGEEGKSAYDSVGPLHFERTDLEQFTIGDKGVTFLFDAGFPHVIQALQPDGQYLLSFAELKSYLRLEGQLGQFIR